MKKLITIWLSVILLSAICFAQTEWTLNEDILTDNNNYYRLSSSDSILFASAGDSIYIFGNDTLEIYVNLGRTLGATRFHGYAQGVARHTNTATVCTLYFEMSIHKGNGSAMNANITETFYALDTILVVADSVGYFDIYPLGNTSLNQRTAYYTLRIFGVTAQVAKIWIKEERINAY